MRLSRTILLGCIALLGFSLTAQRASAAFTIDLSVDGGAFVNVQSGADFSSISYSNAAYLGIFKIDVTSATSDNGASLSDLLGSTNRVTNLTGSTHTLAIRISQTDYTLPAGSKLSVESGMGGKVTAGKLTLTGIFQGYADAGNNLNGTSDFTTGPQNATQTGSTFDTGSAFGVFSRTGNFSVTSISTIELTGNGVMNYSNGVNLTPTPAPAGLVLLASAIPVLGLRRVLRRKTAIA